MTKTIKSKAVDQPMPLKAAEPEVGAAAAPTKRDTILVLLARPHGATLDEMVTATGWLPHTTRAMLTGLKKKGYALTSDKIDGVRRYRVGAGAT